MAYIKSHTVLIRHRKLVPLAAELSLRPSYVLGHLHALWHAALEQQEDGDLSSWTDDFIALSADFQGSATEFVRQLQKYRWLDGKKLHDWLEYAGPYLMKRYRLNDPDRLVAIWAKHGKVYGSSSPGVKKEKPAKEKDQRPQAPRENPVHRVVDAFREMRPGTPTEGPALQEFYARNGKAAKALLRVRGGNVEAALLQLRMSADFYERKALSWTLETVVKDAVDPARLQEKSKPGQAETQESEIYAEARAQQEREEARAAADGEEVPL